MNNNDLINMTQEMIDLIEHVGWTRGSLEDIDARTNTVVAYCTLGAAYKASCIHHVSWLSPRHCTCSSDNWAEEFASYLIHIRAVIPDSVTEPFMHIADWNDRIVKDQYQLVDTYRDFISYLKGMTDERPKEVIS